MTRYHPMSKGRIAFLVYQKDFSERGMDRYFLYEDGRFSEVDSSSVVSIECYLVTHDYWLIAPSLYKEHRKLPTNVIDIVLLAKIVKGIKSVKGDVQPWDISKTIKPLFTDKLDFNSYVEIYYRRKELDFDTYMLFSHKLSEYYDRLVEEASNVGEADRFYTLEMPLFNLLTVASCKGFRVANSIIRRHKESSQLDFYRELKLFAEKHNVLYEVPNEGSIREKLSDLGYNTQDYTLDFLINFMPSRDDYTNDLRSLKKLNKSYRILNSISFSANRLTPIVESHWTSTSRIYHKSPNIQNISKKYRDIFIPDEGKSLCYVDYDQFEVGVMAALSSDPKMKEVYQDNDTYKDLALLVFGNGSMRKKAKILFLSYTYGMSLENIIRSVDEIGGSTKKARDYFSEFSVFESWKHEVYNEFLEAGRIGTIAGNYLNRTSDGALSDKEKRIAVNHVIQGSATYIFKLSLLEISKLDSVDILVPMHDAVLFQHAIHVDPREAKYIFENVMSGVLPSISGKASLEDFYA